MRPSALRAACSSSSTIPSAAGETRYLWGLIDFHGPALLDDLESHTYPTYSFFDLEYSALKMLIEAEQRQREAGVTLWLVGLNPQVYAVIQRSPLGPILA